MVPAGSCARRSRCCCPAGSRRHPLSHDVERHMLDLSSLLQPSASPSLHPIAVVGLGLLLGLRHAGDPDHVVAISAIAARTRRPWPAVRVGLAWGLGHTLTLFIVASGIILFDWVIPPRL